MKTERKNYIATSRRSQPPQELQRKATKAARRQPWTTMEAADLALAKDHLSQLEDKARSRANPGLAGWNTHYCSLCSQFGKHWNEAKQSYEDPVEHAPRCTMHPDDDGPYPGWTAAGRKPKRAPADVRRAVAAPASDSERGGA